MQGGENPVDKQSLCYTAYILEPLWGEMWQLGIERGEIGLCRLRKIWVTVSKFKEFYVQKFDRYKVKHLSDRVELSMREWI